MRCFSRLGVLIMETDFFVLVGWGSRHGDRLRCFSRLGVLIMETDCVVSVGWGSHHGFATVCNAVCLLITQIGKNLQ